MPSTVLLRHSHVSWQCSWRVVKWSRNVEKTARHFASPAANKMAHSAAAQHAKVRWRQNVCASKLFCRFPLKSFVYRILIMSRIRIVVPTNETILKNDLENKTSKLSWGRSSVKSGRYWKPPWHPTMQWRPFLHMISPPPCTRELSQKMGSWILWGEGKSFIIFPEIFSIIIDWKKIPSFSKKMRRREIPDRTQCEVSARKRRHRPTLHTIILLVLAISPDFQSELL